MSPRNRFSVSSLASVVAFVLFMAVLALLPVQPAYAEGEPTVAVITTTVNLATNETSITVPVVVTPTGSYTYTAVSFVLQYNKDCVFINSSSDVTSKQGTFKVQQFSVNNGDGTLSVAMADYEEEIEPLTLNAGTLIEIRFGLQAACMNDPSETALFTFDNVAPQSVTFGRGDNGGNVNGVGEQGTYTLNVNKSPTAISLGGSYTDNLKENVSTYRQIGDLTATDANTGDTHTFVLSSGCVGEDSNDGFFIPAATPTKLFTNLTFNFETKSSYTLCVTANDGRGGSVETTVTFNVGQVNEAPTWLDLSATTLADGAASGTSIGTFTTTGDPDTGATHTYTIMDTGAGSDDYLSFTIGGDDSDELLSAFAADYGTKSLYRIRVKTTDNETPGLTFERQFVIKVVGNAVLSLPSAPDVPYVVAGSSISVPIKYNAVGNDVVTATFTVNFQENCLEYTELTGLQSGFTDAQNDDGADGAITINMSSSTSSLREGAIGYLSFTGTTCDEPYQWSDLTFSGVSLKTTGDVAVTTTSNSSKLVVVNNDGRGDCNSSGQLDAGDFPAIAIEYFDDEGTYGGLTSPHWLLSPRGTYGGSAIGCDANADRVVGSGDIGCAARQYFGLTCGTAVAAASIAPPVVAAPAAIAANPGANVTLPVSLQSQGNGVASLALAVKVDTAQFALDPTDADEDGIPDAVTLNAPAGMLRMAFYDPAAGEIQIVLAGMVMPLPVLEDGIVANIQLVGKPGATGSAAAVALENVSLGDTEGGALPVQVELVAPEGSLPRIYLPFVNRQN